MLEKRRGLDEVSSAKLSKAKRGSDVEACDADMGDTEDAHKHKKKGVCYNW